MWSNKKWNNLPGAIAISNCLNIPWMQWNFLTEWDVKSRRVWNWF